jgi:hypothetical protein
MPAWAPLSFSGRMWGQDQLQAATRKGLRPGALSAGANRDAPVPRLDAGALVMRALETWFGLLLGD